MLKDSPKYAEKINKLVDETVNGFINGLGDEFSEYMTAKIFGISMTTMPSESRMSPIWTRISQRLSI